MKITKHMQSCFLLETNGQKILIDPGTYVFNEEGKTANDFSNINLIIVTHEHSDHFDWENVQKLIEKDNPIFLSTEPVVNQVKEKYPSLDCRVISKGISYQFENLKIEGSESKHGPLPTGKPAPIVSGVVIDDGQTRFYTPGDSTVLDKTAQADIIATPICGQVVMNIDQAKNELLDLKPKLAIPMHYDSPKYPVDVNGFASAMQETGIEVKILQNDESLDFQGAK
jgi:L-ascorbate metabolism protein UlaG (beta-lactamase superfamily)